MAEENGRRQKSCDLHTNTVTQARSPHKQTKTINVNKGSDGVVVVHICKQRVWKSLGYTRTTCLKQGWGWGGRLRVLAKN